ncbi:MAG: chorismate synthase [Lachnospiraceae bacterium]|nr:chorismate synthase [Lachnospiraceae bacterium]
MAGSIYGKLFTISTWGESHGEGLGVVVDGVPAGIPISEEYVQMFLDRRKPGQTIYSTPRKESDKVRILSGVFEGKTTGTPVAMAVFNENQRSGDYSQIANIYRPGHADYTFDAKYGFRDYRGGGRSSGRETIGRVAGGAIAMALLNSLGIEFITYTHSIGNIQIDYNSFDKEYISKSPLYMPDKKASADAEQFLANTMKEGNSSGGVIECVIKNMPVGIGETVFDKLDACLAKGIMSIGAVKGFEIGDGFEAANNTGIYNNDAFTLDEHGQIIKETNHSGGVLGGMSDGSDIVFRAAIKATPSISATQTTVNKSGEITDIQIKGRHDPVIVPRAVVVVEAMAAITIADLLMQNATATLDNIKKLYN